MQTDQQFLQALDTIEAETSPARLAGVDPAALCKRYRDLKPTIEGALKVIELIPVYGKKIAALIRFLMTIADAVCAVVAPA